MASPHVAGIITAYLSRPEYELLSPAFLKAKLITNGNRNLLKLGVLPSLSKTKNRLVYSDPPEHED